MANLRLRPRGERGRVHSVTPQSAGWSHVGFDLWRLERGGQAGGEEATRETCLVLIAGRGRFMAGGQDLGELGDRASPFEGPGHAVYVPAGTAWSVTASGPLELAVCTAPGAARTHPVRVIGPDDVRVSVRGKGTNTRYPRDILPETEPAESLLIVEVVTPGGHTSSYPPHKHDEDRLPHESQLEETYYHRFSRPQGFAFQRVYTDDRSLDEAMLVEDGDVILVPRGYHPLATVAGYDQYQLNVMAGPVRTWKFHDDPAHAWIIER